MGFPIISIYVFWKCSYLILYTLGSLPSCFRDLLVGHLFIQYFSIFLIHILIFYILLVGNQRLLVKGWEHRIPEKIDNGKG